jgi:gliding motility-associated-like protein
VGDVSGMCSNTFTLPIKVSPQPSAKPYIKEDICLGDTVVLGLTDRSDNAATYVWDFAGANIITHNSNSGGPYKVSWSTTGVHVLHLTAYSAEGCKSEEVLDSIKVHAKPDAGIVLPPQNGVYCIDDSLLLNARTKVYTNLYTWSPAHFFSENGSPEIWGRVDAPGYIKLLVSDPFGCTAADSTLFNPDPCCRVDFPTAFTPNNDGKNDMFRPIYHGYHRFSNFRITNRWGETVFESTNNNMSWDGTFNGVPQDMGVYFYFIKYDCGGKSQVVKGEFTLVR